MYPALDSKVKNVTSAYSVEHEDEGRLFEQLSSLLSAALQQKGKERQATLRQLECKIEEVHITLRKHLAKEEEQLFPLLLKHFTFAEQASTTFCYHSVSILSCSLHAILRASAEGAAMTRHYTITRVSLSYFQTCSDLLFMTLMCLQAELVAQLLCCIPLAAVEVVLAWLKPVVPEDEQRELLGHVSMHAHQC